MINKRYTYMLFIVVISLLMIVVMPTYAKFNSGYSTEEDIALFTMDFDVSISNITEYEEIIVKAGDKYKFNVDITNSSSELLYYGIWYRMVSPDTLSNDIVIGRLSDSKVSTSGEITSLDKAIVGIAVINNSSNDIVIDIGVNSSSESIDDIEYIDGKYLITGEVSIPTDIYINKIMINGTEVDGLPKEGYYEMSYSCKKGSKLRWDSLTKTLIYESGSYTMDECSLEFTDKKDYLLLNSVPMGSYVKYIGTGGSIGSKNHECIGDACQGVNANTDINTSDFYGYCNNSDYKYTTKGFRLAYVDSEKRPVIVSAGGLECINGSEVSSKVLDTLALKYCNKELVEGECSCPDDNGDLVCDNTSMVVWSLSERDFNNITNGSGYRSDILNNGGFYWVNSSDDNFKFWHPFYREIKTDDMVYSYGLRPVIRLASEVYITGGSGIMNDPYIIAR